MLEKQALLEAAALLEKNAAWYNTAGKWLRGLAPSPNVQEALKGTGRSLYNSAAEIMQQLPDRAAPHVSRGLSRLGRFVRNGATAGDLRRGVRQMRMATEGPVRQGLFNAGLRNVAKGVGKTGLVYGGALYGGTRLAGDSQPQAYYYGA